MLLLTRGPPVSPPRACVNFPKLLFGGTGSSAPKQEALTFSLGKQDKPSQFSTLGLGGLDLSHLRGLERSGTARAHLNKTSSFQRPAQGAQSVQQATSPPSSGHKAKRRLGMQFCQVGTRCRCELVVPTTPHSEPFFFSPLLLCLTTTTPSALGFANISRCVSPASITNLPEVIKPNL